MFICNKGHVSAYRRCTICGRNCTGLDNSRAGDHGPIIVTTKAGRQREVSVREFRALLRERAAGGPYGRKRAS